jgi:required for meiotic nuclear division protein 1
MALLPIHAYGFASQFRLRDVASCFTGARLRLSKTQVAAEYGADRFGYAFDFGAIVFVNVSAEERARLLGEVRRRVATDEPHAPLEEEFLIEIAPGTSPEGRVTFDRVTLAEVSSPAFELIALLLAQSVAIDYYEEDLQEILATLDKHIDFVAEKGRIPGSRGDLTRFVARTLATKNQIIAALAVLDKPAVTWEKETLDRLYRALREMLEIDDRFRSLEYKLRTIQESLELFLDLQQTRHGHVLETIVVLLILLEIVMALLAKL